MTEEGFIKKLDNPRPRNIRKALKEGRTATARNVSRTIEQVENYLSLSVEEDLLLKVNFVPEISDDFINSWKETSIEKIEKNSHRAL